ncbi:hypothetical protein [Roseovarius aestuariivivens]|uniref:hypothetical protein n=1 Tax=Roseovarius aestuariivivens TaxID=1888910 RepID=UPI00108123BA|nr:hypothetical protein [Roseovarius aestuariivivens]
MLLKKLARAFRWKRMLESGEFTTIAERERILSSYMTRVGIVRLTFLVCSIPRLSFNALAQTSYILGYHQVAPNEASRDPHPKSYHRIFL